MTIKVKDRDLIFNVSAVRLEGKYFYYTLVVNIPFKVSVKLIQTTFPMIMEKLNLTYGRTTEDNVIKEKNVVYQADSMSGLWSVTFKTAIELNVKEINGND